MPLKSTLQNISQIFFTFEYPPQLEPCQKEWIYKAAIGDMESVSRLLLQDKSLVKYKDFISGYTGITRINHVTYIASVAEFVATAEVFFLVHVPFLTTFFIKIVFSHGFEHPLTPPRVGWTPLLVARGVVH